MDWPRRCLLLPLLLAGGAMTASAAPSAPGPDGVEARAGTSAMLRVLVRTGQPAPDGGSFTEFADPALVKPR
jgi:hypothetical protein